MSSIIVKENESLDSALRRFKRSCAKAGIQQEIRKREHYEKPSVKFRFLLTLKLLGYGDYDFKFCQRQKSGKLIKFDIIVIM